jgi:putative DNA primase/helicase
MIAHDPGLMALHLNQLFEPCIEQYPDGLIEIRCICPHSKPVGVKLFEITENGIAAAIDFARGQNAAGKNVYVGVNPRKPGTPRHEAASAADVEIAFHCFGDLDSEESTDRLLEFLAEESEESRYSFAVTTGEIPSTRVHIYWALEEPARNLNCWRDVQRRIATHFAGDSVIDPPRIMRLAGTASYPDAKKKDRGYVSELVTIRTEYEDDRDPVSLEELRKRFSFSGKPGIKPDDQNDNPFITFGDSFDFKPAIDVEKALLAMSYAGTGNAGIHQTQLRVSASMAARGHGDEEIVKLLMSATRKASGQHEASWDWAVEERSIRQMITTGRKMISTNENSASITKVQEGKDGENPGNIDGYDLSEDGIAQAFRDRHEDRLRFDHDQSAWYEWAGSHWREDRTNLAFAWARDIGRELSAAMVPGVRQRVGRAATAGAVEKLAQSDRVFAVTWDNWDADPFLLGTPGGTIDLRTGKLRLSVPWEGITKITAVAPDSMAECPVWKAFLQDATRGDDALIEFLARMVGYSLTGDTREHALFYIHGPGGNGKSVFLNTVAGILGDYARVSAMETFTVRRNEGHPTELAMLRGARLVHASETEEGRAWAESRIKTLTGGDKISARFMRQDFFEFIPQFKLAIVGNHKPVLRSVDDAARRRFNIIPFVYKPTEPDKELEDKLRAEWPAILQWAIEGCMRWQESGLTRPAIVASATDNYFADQDLFGQWLDEMCDLRSDYWESVATLFKSWGDYAKSAAEDAGTKKSFGGTMEKHGLLRDRKNKIRGFAGVRLQESYEAAKWEGGDR